MYVTIPGLYNFSFFSFKSLYYVALTVLKLSIDHTGLRGSPLLCLRSAGIRGVGRAWLVQCFLFLVGMFISRLTMERSAPLLP